uniref:Ephrin RBD domain-containing protein n=1 Tax=Heterorhabditis bacteriophora TaxID=37862 RepID=A0A1I7XD83_HETBA
MEFEQGKTYYFITTSDGTSTGIDRRKDGLCTDRQMKVKFEVQRVKDGPPNISVNPKFAARTSNREDQAASTPIMYIIHVDGEDSDELDDDGSTTSSLSTPLLIAIITFYLL